MPVWEQLSGDHHADVPLTEAWSRLIAATFTEAADRSFDAQPPGLQAEYVRNAIGALGQLYRAANLRPPSEPTYRDLMRMAHGAAIDLSALATLGAPPELGEQGGADARVALGLGLVASRFLVFARAGLADDATAHVFGMSFDGRTPEAFAAFERGATRVHADGSVCTDAWNDWNCIAWTADEPALLLPAARPAVALVRQIAAGVSGDARTWIAAARAAGAVPIVVGAPPPDGFASDLDSVVRPAPAPVEPPPLPPPPLPVPPPEPSEASTSRSAPSVATYVALALAAGFGAAWLFARRSTRPGT